MVTKVLGEALLQLVSREEVERQLDEWLDQDACSQVATTPTDCKGVHQLDEFDG